MLVVADDISWPLAAFRQPLLSVTVKVTLNGPEVALGTVRIMSPVPLALRSLSVDDDTDGRTLFTVKGELVA